DHIADAVLEFIGGHPELPYPDQDAINLVLANKWREISPLWNQIHVVHSYISVDDSPYDDAVYSELIENPRVIHYSHRPKPWGKNCTHPQANRYFRYLDQTAWSGWRNNAFNYNTTLIRRSLRRLKIGITKKLTQLAPSH
ncbi:MAG: glycosyltransferase, partial [Nodosilinea sp.]